MSIHLVGGGWPEDGDADLAGAFLAEAAARAAGSGRMTPRIGVLVVEDDAEPSEDALPAATFAASFARIAACDPVLTVAAGERFDSAVLTGIDGLVVGGGVAPAYAEAVLPLADEIRLLVADGLPYLGYSAGAMIAADRAILGGWRLDGIPICPEDAAEDLDELTVVGGLGLVDLAVEVHAAQWGTLGRLVVATEAGLVAGGVALDEGTGLIVDDDGLRVVGAGNVWQVLDDDAGVIVGTLAP